MRRTSFAQNRKNRVFRTHIDELLQIFIEVGQIVLALLVLGNELLLPAHQLEPLLLESFTSHSLVADACNHQGVLVGVGVLWLLGEEFFDGDER